MKHLKYYVLILLLTYFILPKNALSQCNIDDWKALKALYESTDGGNWTNRTGWEIFENNPSVPLPNCDLNTLHGIKLDSEGRVYCIDLDSNPDDCRKNDNYASGNQLYGKLPEELSLLSNLTHLNLANDYRDEIIKGDDTIKVKKLNSTIPSSLGSLEKLVYLELSFHNITGEIPDELTELSNLEILALYGNQLSGTLPDSIGKLTNLFLINLAGNQISGEIPSSIVNLQKLWFLYLNGNQLSGAIPDKIMCLPDLLGMSLSENQLTGNIPVCPESNFESNLKELFLGGNQLSGVIPAQINQFKKLRKLGLSYNQLIGKLPVQLGELDSLIWLYLSGNQFIGEIPEQIGDMGNLNHLFLNENQLSGKLPLSLCDLNKLEQLWFSNNRFNGTIPNCLGELTELTFLYLSNNEFSGAIPSSMGKLSKLGKLGLSHNYLTGSIPESLNQITPLSELWLSSNRLSGQIPVTTGNVNLRMNISNNYFDCKQINDFVETNDIGPYRPIYMMPQIYTPVNYDSIKVVPRDTSIILTAMYNGDMTNANYQWFRNGDTLTGNINSTLMLQNMDASKVGSYTLKVNNVCSNIEFISKPVYVVIEGLDLYGQPVKAQQLVVEFDNPFERDSVFAKIKSNPIVNDFKRLDSCKYVQPENINIQDTCAGIPLIYLLEFESTLETQSAALIINAIVTETIVCPADIDTLRRDNSNPNNIITEIDVPASDGIIYNLPDIPNQCQGSDSVSVFILDTGINVEDVSSDDPNLFAEITGCKLVNFYNEPNGNSHGTYGYKLIADNTCTQITPLSIFDSEGEATVFDLISAIYTAIENDADIINISAGYSGQPSSILEKAIEVARDKGIFIITSAGNEGIDIDKNPQLPAFYASQGNTILNDDGTVKAIEKYDNLVTVASINQDNTFSKFSNFGERSATIAAYGENLYAYNLFCPEAAVSGTSMAAFLVTRQLALEIAENPSRNYNQIWSDFESNHLDTLMDMNANATSTGKKLVVDLEETTTDSCDSTCNDGLLNGDETEVDCGGTCQECPSTCKLVDWNALKAIYQNTDGDNWNKNEGWEIVNASKPPQNCDLSALYGVQINEDGRVIEINLYNNNLTGRLPAQIGDLSELKALYLTSQNLNGSIPFEIAKLTKLKYLFLVASGISGNIPPELGKLNNLLELRLSYNSLSGEIPKELGDLLNLTYLSLNHNDLSGCYPNELNTFCEQLIENDGNVDISDGNNFDTDWEIFCALGEGACSNLRSSDLNSTTIYPNPSSGNIYVEFKITNEQNRNVSIYNTMGEVCKTISPNAIKSNIIELDLKNLPRGVYFVEIRNGFSSKTHKLILQ